MLYTKYFYCGAINYQFKLEKTIRMFKIDQIVEEVVLMRDTHEIPSDFKAIEYLDSA